MIFVLNIQFRIPIMTTPPNQWYPMVFFMLFLIHLPGVTSAIQHFLPRKLAGNTPYLDWHKIYSIGRKKKEDWFCTKIGNSPLQMLSVLQHMSNLAGSIQCPTISIGPESPAESQLRGTLQVLLAALMGKETHGPHGAGDRNINSYLLKWGLPRPHQLKFGDKS